MYIALFDTNFGLKVRLWTLDNECGIVAHIGNKVIIAQMRREIANGRISGQRNHVGVR